MQLGQQGSPQLPGGASAPPLRTPAHLLHLGRAQPRRQLPVPHLPQFMGQRRAPPSLLLLLLLLLVLARSVLCGRASLASFWLLWPSGVVGGLSPDGVVCLLVLQAAWVSPPGPLPRSFPQHWCLRGLAAPWGVGRMKLLSGLFLLRGSQGCFDLCGCPGV